MADEIADTSLLELATELTMAWLANPNTRASAEEVPAFLQSMHGAVTTLATGPASAEEDAPKAEFIPAVTVRRSLASKDHIVSLIDGKAYKTLKRHLSGHGLTPAEYRERYGLKADYPMVAENYAEMRRGFAKKIGLGRKAGTKVVAGKAAAKPASVKAAAKPAAVKTDVTPVSAKTEAKPAIAKSAGKPAVAQSATKPALKPAQAKTQRRARTAAPDTTSQS